MTSLVKFLKYKPYPLVKPGDSCVLSSYILPGSRGIRKIGWDYNILWLVQHWAPVRYCPHTWGTITIPATYYSMYHTTTYIPLTYYSMYHTTTYIPLTEVSILWLGMTTPVRVMEGNIEEERRVLGDGRG